MKKVELGDKVRDMITGFKGIAVARTTWIEGCDRITIQPEGVNKEGGIYEGQTFDEPLIEVIRKKKRKKVKSETGGPMPNPKSKPSVG